MARGPRAELVAQVDVDFPDGSFIEGVVWRVPNALRGSLHTFKYRLAFVVANRCVLRYDNEAGKGDHRHEGDVERAYVFTNVDQLLRDFAEDVERWRREHGHVPGPVPG